jgi:hypothetical protein
MHKLIEKKAAPMKWAEYLASAPHAPGARMRGLGFRATMRGAPVGALPPAFHLLPVGDTLPASG